MKEKDLFGEIQKLRAEGGNKVNIEKLLKPLEDEDALMRSFCKGCGLLSEIYEKEALEQAQKAGVKLPEDPRSYYFQTGKCTHCDSEDEGIELLPVAAQA